jgi:cell fate regulator YaaT (PSP1 superfamily)
MHHYVRVGLLGQIGRFRAADGTHYPRGARVVCRTARGLELGEVLSLADSETPRADGALLRRVTVEDDLLLDRLARHREEAYAACAELLHARGLGAVLVDVEHLFDGQSLFFYFLGETTPELDALTEELGALYDAKVQFQKFAQTLTAGCGPDCGTEAAAGQGCGAGGCSTCAVAKACHAT